LGYTSWLATRFPGQNDSQVVLTLPTIDEISAALRKNPEARS
jgi:hypothetical protein